MAGLSQCSGTGGSRLPIADFAPLHSYQVLTRCLRVKERWHALSTRWRVHGAPRGTIIISTDCDVTCHVSIFEAPRVHSKSLHDASPNFLLVSSSSSPKQAMVLICNRHAQFAFALLLCTATWALELQAPQPPARFFELHDVRSTSRGRRTLGARSLNTISLIPRGWYTHFLARSIK